MNASQIIVRAMLKEQLLKLQSDGVGYYHGKFCLASKEDIDNEIERRTKNDPQWFWIYN